jgi:phage terminase small subunit
MPATPMLTLQEQAFVATHLECRIATQAYIAAGYSPKGADANASRLMGKDSVAAAIQAGLAEAKKRHIKTVDDIVDELSKLAFTGLDRFVHIDEDGQPTVDMSRCTPEDLRLLSEITVKTWLEGPKDGPKTKVTETKLKLNDRVRTLEMLGKHLGLFKEGPNSVPPNPLADALREILARGSALPVRIMGPLGSGRRPMRIVNPERTLDAAE